MDAAERPPVPGFRREALVFRMRLDTGGAFRINAIALPEAKKLRPIPQRLAPKRELLVRREQ